VESLPAQYLFPGHGNLISGAKVVKDNFKQIKEYWFRYL
jgi:hypothetical protein